MGLSWPLLGKKKAQHPPRQPKLGRKWVLSAFRAASWGALGANLGLSGGSGALLGAILGPSWGHFGAILGPCAAIFGQPKRFVAEKADKQKTSKNHWFLYILATSGRPARAILGPSGASWGPFWGCLGPSWDTKQPNMAQDRPDWAENGPRSLPPAQTSRKKCPLSCVELRQSWEKLGKSDT